MSAPLTPEQITDAIEVFVRDGGAQRFVVQTRYGSIELPADEIWYAEATRTIHLSVRIPENYDLVKLP